MSNFLYQNIFFNKAGRFFSSMISRILITLVFFIVSYIYFFSHFCYIMFLIDQIEYLFFLYIKNNPGEYIFHHFKGDLWVNEFYKFYLKNWNLVLPEAKRSIKYAFVLSLLFFIGLNMFFVWLHSSSKNGIFRRGERLVSVLRLRFELYWFSVFNRIGLSRENNDLRVGKENIRVPRQLGASMWGFVGNSGTGKSREISHFLNQIRSFGEKVMVVDPDGEYYKIFGKKDDVILSLYDVRSELYSFWGEEVSSMEMAQILIENHSHTSPFWSKASQALFAGIMELCSDEQEMYKMFFMPVSELKKKLEERGLPGGVALGSADTAANVKATALADVYWLKHLNLWPRLQGKTKPFSIKKWTHNNTDKRWVFLVSSQSHWDLSKPLMRLWTDLFVLSAFERGTDKSNVPLWLVCDELASIGKLPSMSRLEDRGRKYRMGLLAGFQSPSQLEVIYGPALTKSILQGLQNQLFFRATEGEMAHYMSKALGEPEYHQEVLSQSVGDRNSASVSYQVVRKRNVLEDELVNLKDMKAYLKLSYQNAAKISINRDEYPIINKPDMSFNPDRVFWDGMIDGKQFVSDDALKKAKEEYKFYNLSFCDNDKKIENKENGIKEENCDKDKKNTDMILKSKNNEEENKKNIEITFDINDLDKLS